MTPLRLIGYWRNAELPMFPDPQNMVDEAWDQEERHQVATYLEHGLLAVQYRGLSPCRICDKDNGSRELTDGVYQWPEGLAHYVRDHRVRLPDEFNTHALKRTKELEDEPCSPDWWLSSTS